MFVQDDFYQYDMDVVATVMAQLLLKAAALKMWGNDARLSTKAKVKQLHWRNSFEPVHHKSLTVMRLKQILARRRNRCGYCNKVKNVSG